jgi:hypothetical protein
MLFFLSYGIFLFAKIIDHTYFEFSDIYKFPLILFSMAIMIKKILTCNRYSKANLTILVIVLLLFTIAMVNSGTYLLVYTILFIFGAKDIEFDKILHIFIYIASVLIVITIICFLCGLISESTTTRNGIVRHSLGYTYPTDLAAMFVYIFLADLYLAVKHNYKIIVRCLLYTIVALLVWHVCDARLGSVTILLFVPMAIFMKKYKRWNDNRVLNFFVKYSFFICSGLMFLVTHMYFWQPKCKLLLAVDSLLSYRLTFNCQAVKSFGYSWFGQDIYDIYFKTNTKYFFIDSSYYILLIQYGFIVFMLIGLGFLIIVKREIGKKEYYIPFILMIISINSLIGQQLFLLEYNPFLLLLFADTRDRYSTDKAVN